MSRILFVIFIVLPILELSLLIHVGGIIGVFNTFAWLLITAALGIFLMRYAGLRTFVDVRQRMAQGKPPGQALLKGVLQLVAGLMFLLPGIVTDSLALLLILPITGTLMRWGVMILLAKVARNSINVATVSAETVVEGEFRQESQPPYPDAEQTETRLKLPEK